MAIIHNSRDIVHSCELALNFISVSMIIDCMLTLRKKNVMSGNNASAEVSRQIDKTTFN